MTRRALRIAVLSVGCLGLPLGFAQLAGAQEWTNPPTGCGDPSPVIPDGRIYQGQRAGNAGAFFVRVFTVQGASYSVEAHLPFLLGTFGPGMPVEVFNPGNLFPIMCTGSSTLPSTDTTNVAPRIVLNGSRRSFIGTGQEVFVRIGYSLATTETVQVSVAETTLFGPRWSTFGGFHTEFGFRNTTNATINGTLTLFNDDGTVNVTSTFAIPVNGATFRDTRAVAVVGPEGLGVANDKKGSATFTHDGPPGAILADIFIVHPGFPTGPFVVPGKFEAARQMR